MSSIFQMYLPVHYLYFLPPSNLVSNNNKKPSSGNKRKLQAPMYIRSCKQLPLKVFGSKNTGFVAWIGSTKYNPIQVQIEHPAAFIIMRHLEAKQTVQSQYLTNTTLFQLFIIKFLTLKKNTCYGKFSFFLFFPENFLLYSIMLLPPQKKTE